MDNKKEDYSYNAAYHMRRIADALEEVIRLVKKDQEESKKRWEEREEN